MVEKKKALKQLVFLVCTLIVSSSVVNAQTIRARCPAGTSLVSGTSKCCPSYNTKYKSIKAHTVSNNVCVYDFTGSSIIYKNEYVPGTNIYCSLSKLLYGCRGSEAKDVTESYTTTVYLQHSWGGEYKTYICKQAECQWTESYDGCPSGTYFAGWQQVSGRGYTDGSFVQTTSDATANYTLTVKALCNYNKPPVTTTRTETEEEPKQIEEPVEEVCPASDNKEKITNINNYKITYNLREQK